jgi:hypothetical protein
MLTVLLTACVLLVGVGFLFVVYAGPILTGHAGQGAISGQLIGVAILGFVAVALLLRVTHHVEHGLRVHASRTNVAEDAFGAPSEPAAVAEAPPSMASPPAGMPGPPAGMPGPPAGMPAPSPSMANPSSGVPGLPPALASTPAPAPNEPAAMVGSPAAMPSEMTFVQNQPVAMPGETNAPGQFGLLPRRPGALLFGRTYSPASLGVGALVLGFMTITFAIAAVSSYNNAQRSAFVQHHGTSVTATVISVNNQEYCGRRYCHWTAMIPVTLSRPVDGVGTTTVHFPEQSSLRSGEQTMVLVDPKEPGYAELPGYPFRKAWGWIFLALIALAAGGGAAYCAWRRIGLRSDSLSSAGGAPRLAASSA